MRRLDYMVLRQFVPVFLVALTLFTLIIELADLFSNIVSYLNQNVKISEIIRVQLLYLPKSISYALPICLLFSVSFTLGTLYSNNELISVFGAGVPLLRFVLPLLVLGALFTVATFFFQERVVIGTLQAKTELSHKLLNMRQSESNTETTVLGENGRIVYYAEYYNDTTRTLNNLIVVVRNDAGELLRRIDADWAVWDGTSWVLHNVRDFSRTVTAGKYDLVQTKRDTLSDPMLNQPPATFGRISSGRIGEMPLPEARTWITSLRKAGLPYRSALTSYYERFSFAMTPFLVVLMSAAIGGRFKKNILLMSLLVSLVLSVVYYVAQMLAGLLSNVGLLQPLFGAWAAVAIFSVTGVLLFRTSRT
ncbi:MAG TPA: LptF/LptG family permease [Spirochaetia bacterium]|nr:LptF/LptG family permease [Spirochaetia bacterium]